MAMPKAISHAIKHRLGALPWVSRGNSQGKGIMHSLGTNSLNWYCEIENTGELFSNKWQEPKRKMKMPIIHSDDLHCVPDTELGLGTSAISALLVLTD